MKPNTFAAATLGLLIAVSAGGVCRSQEPAAQPAADTLVQQGTALVQQGKLDGALKAFSDAIRVQPTSDAAYYGRGYCYEQLGKYEPAMADLTEALRLNPTQPHYYSRIADCYRATGSWSQAIEGYTSALRVGALPINWTVYVYWARGDAKLSKGDVDGAIADFSAAIERDSDDVTSYGGRAEAWARKGDLDKEIADWNEYLRRTNRESAPYKRRAIALAKNKRLDEAEADIRRFESLVSDARQRYLLRGFVAFYGRDYRTARHHFEKAIQANPGDAPASEAVKGPLPASWLASGEAQVKRLCEDRPAIRRYLEANADLQTAIVRKFAGEDHHRPIHWSPKTPVGAYAVSDFLCEPNAILVASRSLGTDGKPHDVSPESQLIAVVYELHNVSNAPSFRRLYRCAMEGSIPETEFVRQMALLEREAAEQTRAFYVRTVIRTLETQNEPPTTHPLLWYVDDWPESNDDAQASAAMPRSDYRWKNYQRIYRRQRFKYFVENREWDSAREQLDPIVELAKNPSDRINELIVAGNLCLFSEGDVAAFAAYRTAADLARQHNLNEDLAECLTKMGRILASNGKVDEGLKNLDAAVSLRPDYALGLFARASVARDAGRSLNQVGRDLDEALRLDPRYVEALKLRASLNRQNREVGKAIPDYEQLTVLQPNEAWPYLALADCLIAGEGDHRNPARAVEMATKGCEKTAWSDPAALALLARCYAANKDFSSAAKYQDQAMRLAPEYDRQRYRDVLEQYRQAAKKAQPAAAP